jgi:hypothetical protein
MKDELLSARGDGMLDNAHFAVMIGNFGMRASD